MNKRCKNCHHSTGASKQFPYLDVQHLNEEDRDELITRLELDSKRIKRKFASLVTKTVVAMEASQTTTSERIKEFLNECDMEDLADSIQPQCTVFTAMKKVGESKPWSFFDYEILEDLIEAFCTNDKSINDVLTQYKSYFREYCKRRLDEITPECFSMSIHAHPKSKICMKVDKLFFGKDINSKELLSGKENGKEMASSLISIKELQLKFSELLGIKHLTLLSIESGCIKLTFRHFKGSNPLPKISTISKIVMALLEVKTVACEAESYDLQMYNSPPPNFKNVSSQNSCKCIALLHATPLHRAQ